MGHSARPMPVRASSLCARFTWALLALALGIGCGASESTVREPMSAPANAPPDASAASEAAEAERLIEAQLDAHREAVRKCVDDYIAKNDSLSGEIDFAIDQEGTLVGVVVSGTKKDGKDPELIACVTTALHDAMFPKRRSGIITVPGAIWDGF